MTETPLRATITQRGVIVTPDDHVLVVQRASDGGWELPGGRLGSGEDVRVGLARELREETTLDPEIVAPVHTVAWENDAGKDRFATYYYCRGVRNEVALSDEHDDAEWRPTSVVGQRLSDPQQSAVEATLGRHRTRMAIDS
jgi:8-oxo-dGTP pyrophosphatase MutT (NUDIX family)